MQMATEVMLIGGPQGGTTINIEGSGAYIKVPIYMDLPVGRFQWGWAVYRHNDGDVAAEFMSEWTVAGW